MTSPCITSAGGEGEAVTLQELRLTAAAATCRGHVVVFCFFYCFVFLCAAAFTLGSRLQRIHQQLQAAGRQLTPALHPWPLNKHTSC